MNIYRKIFGLCWLRNFSTDPDITAIVKKILDFSDIAKVDFVVDGCYIAVTIEDMTYYLWDENKYYAWLHRGFVRKNGQTVFAWKDAMPSRKISYEFKLFLGKKAKEIFCSKITETEE